MAMNKKEQAEMVALKSQVATLLLLVGTSHETPPKPMTRQEIFDTIKETKQGPLPGWFVNDYLLLELGPMYRGGSLSRVITLGCSSSIHHNTSGPKTTTQEMGRMWRTQREALLYARALSAQKFGERLAAIDTLLAAAK